MTQHRDDELDDLEKQLHEAQTVKGTPFIERPETMEIRDGLLCWLDGNRVCGPDCVAYNTDEVDDNNAVVQGPNKCTVLAYMGQQASAAMSTLLVNRKLIHAHQDAERVARGGGLPPIPTATGKRT